MYVKMWWYVIELCVFPTNVFMLMQLESEHTAQDAAVDAELWPLVWK